MRTAVVFVGGPHSGAAGVAPQVVDAVTAEGAALVVAVDSGLHVALDLGRTVDLVVGDMDSVDEHLLADAESAGATVQRHPVDKDATDLELAMDAVVGAGCDRLVVVAADSGRMDHLIGGALTLCSPRFAALRIDAWLGATQFFPVHDRVQVRGRPGALVSVMPVGGAASGVRTTGLRWPLDGERLLPGTSRGLSNEFLDDVASVSVDGGCVAVVIPHEETR